MAFPFSCTCLVLCGKTGSGKTLLLHQLELSGYPSINLEEMASHRGSVFGGFLLPPQPSQRDFEIALEKACSRYASSNYIFIESKPSSIGKRKIPTWMYDKINEGLFIQLEVDKKKRISNILAEYTAAGKKSFMEALRKLKGRLTEAELQKSEAYLQCENYEKFIEAMLGYYDRSARYQLHKRADIVVPLGSVDPADTLRQFLQSLRAAGIYM